MNYDGVKLGVAQARLASSAGLLLCELESQGHAWFLGGHGRACMPSCFNLLLLYSKSITAYTCTVIPGVMGMDHRVFSEFV